METVLNLETTIQLTAAQLAELARQLPKKERAELVRVLLIEDDDGKTKEEVISGIQEALEEVKLYKSGKVQLRTMAEFLEDA